MIEALEKAQKLPQYVFLGVGLKDFYLICPVSSGRWNSEYSTASLAAASDCYLSLGKGLQCDWLHQLCLSLLRYKEHEDGYMRLQLVRYESVELTEQLLKDREKRGEALGGSTECVVLSEGEGNLQGIILEAPEEAPLVENSIAELQGALLRPAACSADNPKPAQPSAVPGAPLSSEQEPSTPANPIIRVVNRTNEHGESETVYYVMASTSLEEQVAAPSGLATEQEENVMDRLQKTAEELGIQIV